MHLKRTLWVFGSLAVLALIRTLTAGSAWQEMRATGSRLEQVVADRNTTRLVLRGEPIDGLAFDEYAQVAELLAESVQDDRMAVARARLDGEPEATELRDALIDEHREMLAALDRGARCTDSRFPVRWRDGFNIKFPSLLNLRAAVTISVLSAERHIEEGQPDLAVDALLNAMQLGRDLAESPFLINEMIGVSLLVIASKEALIDDGLLECLPANEQQRLADAIRALDESMSPTSQAWEGELAAFVRCVTTGVTPLSSDNNLFGGFSSPVSLRSLPYGFSESAMLADYVQHSDRSLQELAALTNDTYLERVALHAELEAMDSRHGDALGKSLLAVWPSIEKARRDGIALLRLTRTAAEYSATGHATPLSDPYGSELLITHQGDTLRVESAGYEEMRNPNRLAIELDRDED